MSERNSLQMDDYAALFDCLSTDMPLPDIFDISYSTDVRINASSDNDEIPILPPLFSLEPPSGGYESPASEYLTLLQDPYLHPMNSISKDSPKPMVSDDLSFANICQTIANEFPGSIKSEIPRISSNEYTYLINNKHSNSKVRHGPSAIKHESQRSKKCAHSRSNKHILRLANADLPRSLKTEFKHGIKCESLSGPKPSPEHCTQLAIKPVVSVELEDAFNAMLYQEIRGECLTPGCHAPVRVRGYCKKHGGARKCSVSGCTKGIQGKSRCIGHGGGKRCSTIGCTKSAQSHGLCKAHGGGVRCKYAGCTKSSQGGGLCRKHGGGRRCQDKSGCNRGAQRGAFCAKHGGVRKCVARDCQRTDRGGGYCEVHRRSFLCTLERCNKLARSYGLCTMHIRELRLHPNLSITA